MSFKSQLMTNTSNFRGSLLHELPFYSGGDECWWGNFRVSIDEVLDEGVDVGVGKARMRVP